MRVLTQSSSGRDLERLGGNKASSLHRLGSCGVMVPKWAALASSTLTTFQRESGLDGRIADLLRDVRAESAERVAEEIAKGIAATDISPAIRALVAEALSCVGDGPIAVRSSGVEEDSAALSFAGQFDTYLNVQGLDAVVACVKKCWASAYSARSLLYRLQHGLDASAIEMAVILQRLIHAEKSGVVFTVNPSNRSSGEIVISSVYGLGEGLVSGAIDADTIILDKQSGAIKASILGEKRQRADGTGLVDVPPELQQQLSIDAGEIERIRVAAQQVERACGRPQDIEWCIDRGGLWILQARPVTTPVFPSDGELRIWDNSNIIENYPGVTSQLTFTFAQHVYANVFRNFCALLMIPERHLKEMDGFLHSVLGYINGRVYYNLLHWYKLSGTAPFQDLGRKMMELQMGVDVALDLKSFEEKIKPYHPRSEIEGFYIRALSTGKFAWYFASLERGVAQFRDFFYAAYQKYEAIDYQALSADQVYAHYRTFESEVMSQWGRMIALESSIGLSYGLLRILIQRWIPDAPEWFQVAVIGGIEGIESVAPVRRLGELAAAARATPELERLLREAPAADAYDALRSAGHAGFLELVDGYIKEFGYRSNNELKLEEPDMREDPSVLFEMLKAALVTNATADARDPGRIRAVEELVDKHLSSWQRWVFERVRSRVRAAIGARETVRFCRSRAFGVVRRMFRAIGDDFARLGILDDGRDVFHLRLEELRGCIEGTVSHLELKPLVVQRKRDDAAYRRMPSPPARFVTRGPVVGWCGALAGAAAPSEGAAKPGDTGGELRGVACSPGSAEGEAKVVREPSEFHGGVLVTYRTDPGWVAVFSAAEALLIERGSPLTHAAIVARELGIPTIVQIPGLTAKVKSGMRLKIDGNAGTIAILSEAAAPVAG